MNFAAITSMFTGHIRWPVIGTFSERKPEVDIGICRVPAMTGDYNS